MDIKHNQNTFFGLTQLDDSLNDEYIYTVGLNNQLPIALALLMSSKFNGIVNRYFSLKTHDEKADELAKELLKQTIDLTSFTNKFDNIKAYEGSLPINLEPWTPPAFNMDLINIPNYNLVFEFNHYARKFSQFLAMRTFHYHTCSNSTPHACSMGYINYENRPEFGDTYKAVDNALNSIMQDVIRILKLREIDFNEHNMTINVPDFKPVQFKVYYGF